MATIKDVARMAGVSISTVSKYLNGGNVRPEYAEPVRKAIAELDYHANPYARNLRAAPSRSIGVLLPTLTVSFFGHIISALDRTLRAGGYHTVICCYETDHGLERDYLSFLLNNGIDGLVYMPDYLSAEEYLELTEKSSIPVVQVDRIIQGVQTDAVLSDNTDSTYKAVTHFIAKGHRRIALITGPTHAFTARERLVGYLRALSDHSIPYDDALVFSGGFNFTNGYQSFQKLMTLPDPPTAACCVNDDITVGVIAAGQEYRNQSTKSVDIFGYDCVDVCSLMSPAIPVVHQPEEEIGQLAGTYLMERLEGYNGPPRISRLHSTIIY